MITDDTTSENLQRDSLSPGEIKDKESSFTVLTPSDEKRRKLIRDVEVRAIAMLDDLEADRDPDAKRKVDEFRRCEMEKVEKALRSGESKKSDEKSERKSEKKEKKRDKERKRYGILIYRVIVSFIFRSRSRSRDRDRDRSRRDRSRDRSRDRDRDRDRDRRDRDRDRDRDRRYR